MTILDDKLVPKALSIIDKFGKDLTYTISLPGYDPATGANTSITKIPTVLDTFVDSAQATTVKGLGLNLSIGQQFSSDQHMILVFDLTAYPNSIDSAVLHFHVNVSPIQAHDWEIRRLTETRMIESQTSWTHVFGTTSWPGGDGAIGDTDDTTPAPITGTASAGLVPDSDYTFATITTHAVDAIDNRSSMLYLHIQQVGSNTIASLVFHQRTGPNGSAFEPRLWITLDDEVTTIRKSSPPMAYAKKYIDGQSVHEGDMMTMVAASGLTFDPATGMQVLFDGTKWNIVRVSPIYSGDLIAVYELQLRQ